MLSVMRFWKKKYTEYELGLTNILNSMICYHDYVAELFLRIWLVKVYVGLSEDR